MTGMSLKRDLEDRDRAGIAQNVALPITYASQKDILTREVFNIVFIYHQTSISS